MRVINSFVTFVHLFKNSLAKLNAKIEYKFRNLGLAGSLADFMGPLLAWAHGCCP